jgi:hypothetical protein
MIKIRHILALISVLGCSNAISIKTRKVLDFDKGKMDRTQLLTIPLATRYKPYSNKGRNCRRHNSLMVSSKIIQNSKGEQSTLKMCNYANYDYIAKIDIGTPRYTLNVLLDTGSGLNWCLYKMKPKEIGLFSAAERE